jgi:DNA-binding transcriptional LysR family regulator
MRNAAGQEMPLLLPESIVVNDPTAMREAALLGLGVAMLAMADAVPALESGALTRLVPGWYADAGAISLYYASRTLLPGKTRAFVDWVVDAFGTQKLAERFAGSFG